MAVPSEGHALLYVPFRNQHMVSSPLPASEGFRNPPETGRPELSIPLPLSDLKDRIERSISRPLSTTCYLYLEEALEFRRKFCDNEDNIMKYRARRREKTCSNTMEEVMITMKKTVSRTSNYRYHLQRDERKISDVILAREWTLNKLCKKNMINT